MSAKLTLLPNGPLKVEGAFTLHDGKGQAFSIEAGKMAFVCRCGQSSKGPFCDGTHAKCGFKADVPAV